MGQLYFLGNVNYMITANKIVSDGSLTFFPFNVLDSISWASINLLVRTSSSANQTHSVYLGIYSLNGGTLSLTNDASRTISTAGSGRGWLSFASTAAQNITPGTWFLGILARTGGTNAFQVVGSSISVTNNFPGSFIGGIYSASTNALPASAGTSEVTTSGDLFEPCIILSS